MQLRPRLVGRFARRTGVLASHVRRSGKPRTSAGSEVRARPRHARPLARLRTEVARTTARGPWLVRTGARLPGRRPRATSALASSTRTGTRNPRTAGALAGAFPRATGSDPSSIGTVTSRPSPGSVTGLPHARGRQTRFFDPTRRPFADEDSCVWSSGGLFPRPRRWIARPCPHFARACAGRSGSGVRRRRRRWPDRVRLSAPRTRMCLSRLQLCLSKTHAREARSCPSVLGSVGCSSRSRLRLSTTHLREVRSWLSPLRTHMCLSRSQLRLSTT